LGFVDHLDVSMFDQRAKGRDIDGLAAHDAEPDGEKQPARLRGNLRLCGNRGDLGINQRGEIDRAVPRRAGCST